MTVTKQFRGGADVKYELLILMSVIRNGRITNRCTESLSSSCTLHK